MKIGLIGLPGSGKSTCFAAVTGLPPQPSGAGERVGVVPVPERRLPRLAEIYRSAKIVYPEITLVDTPPLPPDQPGEAIAQHLARLAQEAAAFVLILQCFGDLDHTGRPLDPLSDLETILLELALADLSLVERRLARIAAEPKRERNVLEIQLLEHLRDELSRGRLVRELGLTAEQRRWLSGLTLVSALPLLLVCNVAEDDLTGEKARKAIGFAHERRLASLVFCATLEWEIAQLPPDEQASFLQDYGLEASARERFIRAAYELLGLITFLTANEREAHAWPLRQGATALEAAGKIHSDMAKGFIRAEIVAFDDLDRYGSLAECRKHGLVRLEGRDYIVCDGDVLEIRFSR